MHAAGGRRRLSPGETTDRRCLCATREPARPRAGLRSSVAASKRPDKEVLRGGRGSAASVQTFCGGSRGRYWTPVASRGGSTLTGRCSWRAPAWQRTARRVPLTAGLPTEPTTPEHATAGPAKPLLSSSPNVLSRTTVFLSRRRPWPQLDHEEIVKRARLLVVDDKDFPYLKLFRANGYTMDKWSKLKDLPGLESGKYDVILLDLQGVGNVESTEQGLGVLGHLREVSPAQIVVAYSNAEWSVEYQAFFQSADAVLHKSKDDYVTFKRTVDSLLDQRFSLGFYLDRATRELHGSGVSDAVTKKIENAILRNDAASLERYLSKHVDDTVTVERVIGVVQVAIGVAQLWNS